MHININIGIVFGCYIPLHTGHMKLIDTVIRENDMTIIGVTGHDMDRGRDFVPFLRRVRLMQEIYGSHPSVCLSEVDDKKLGLTGTFSTDAWRLWCDELFSNAKHDLNLAHNYTWYTGEQRYIDRISEIYPWHNFRLADRTEVPLSGTAIRNDPVKYKNDIHPVYIRYMQQNGILPT